MWHELNLAITFLFSFFNECSQIINSPSCCVLDAWNTISKFVSLTWNFLIFFMNSLHLLLIFTHSLNIRFFWFCWIKPSSLIRNSFNAQKLHFYHLNSVTISWQWNYLIRQWEMKVKTILAFEPPEKISGFYITFHFI